MTTWIIFLPALLTFLATMLRSPEWAFLTVYIPVLMLLPQIYVIDFQGFPPLTFHKAAIIPIAAYSFFARFGSWKISASDFFVLGYTGICFYSEYVNAGTKDAINLLADMLCSVAAPYYLAKVLIVPKNNTVPLAKRIVFLIFMVVILCAYEMRMTLNPFVALIRPLFPGQGWDWPTLYRYGFVRIGGPFVQPILFGIMIAVAILLNYWLSRNKFWKKNFGYLPPLFFRKGAIISAVLLFGLLMTFSRAPWISCLLGFLLAGVGFAKNRWRSFFYRFSAVILVLGGAWLFWGYYTAINENLASTESEATAAYRGRMIREYMDIALAKPWLGWGSHLWPKIAWTGSIDNQYLWLFLKHGMLGVFAFLLIFIWVSGRVFYRGMRTPMSFYEDSSLAFTFFGIYVTLGVPLATVYMGMQIEPLFFIITGWTEGFLLSSPSEYSSGKHIGKRAWFKCR